MILSYLFSDAGSVRSAQVGPVVVFGARREINQFRGGDTAGTTSCPPIQDAAFVKADTGWFLTFGVSDFSGNSDCLFRFPDVTSARRAVPLAKARRAHKHSRDLCLLLSTNVINFEIRRLKTIKVIYVSNHVISQEDIELPRKYKRV